MGIRWSVGWLRSPRVISSSGTMRLYGLTSGESQDLLLRARAMSGARRLLTGANELTLVRKHDGLHTVTEFEFCQQMRHVGLHCGFAHEQRIGDFGI